MASTNEVEIYLKSAKDLKNVNWRHGFNKPYAVIWVDPSRKVSSWVAEQDTCPMWNQTLVIPLDGPIEEATLHIDIKHAEEICKPLIGSVEIPLREVVDVGIGSRASRELKLKRPSGRLQGELGIDVAVRQPRLHATEPYKALFELLGNALPLQDHQTISAPSLGGFPHVPPTYTQPINLQLYMNYMQNICVLQPQPSNAPPGYAGQQYLFGQRYAQPRSWAASLGSSSTFK